MTTAEESLASVFGFSAFRPGQAEIVRAVTEGRNTLAIMPTGGGKSLCFQLPALLREGVTVVISPLIALMRDQVRALREAGVGAGAYLLLSGPAPSIALSADPKNPSLWLRKSFLSPCASSLSRHSSRPSADIGLSRCGLNHNPKFESISRIEPPLLFTCRNGRKKRS